MVYLHDQDHYLTASNKLVC